VDAFDQSGGKLEHSAEVRLFPRHLTIIALVVQTRQMKNSVQGQDLHLGANGMAQTSRILRGNIGGNRNLPRERPCTILAGRLLGRKGKNIRCFIQVAESQVQRAHRTAAGDQNIYACPKSNASPRAQDKPFERSCAQSDDFLF
jgi:hypothetical protein